MKVLVRQNYRDFGPPLAAEALQVRHGLQLSRETQRKWGWSSNPATKAGPEAAKPNGGQVGTGEVGLRRTTGEPVEQRSATEAAGTEGRR